MEGIPGQALLIALYAASLAAHKDQSFRSGKGEDKMTFCSLGVKTRSRKRIFLLFFLDVVSVRSTMSLPTWGKIDFLHHGKFLDALGCVMPVRSAAGQLRRGRFDNIEKNGKFLSPAGQIAVCMLPVSPEINAQHFAFLAGVDQLADTVREIVRIHTADPGTSAFRENQNILFVSQHLKTLIECGTDLPTIAAAADRYTFR